MDKAKRVKDMQGRIRLVLMESWDPLCVQGAFKPEDEYDSVIGRIYHLLKTNPTEEEVAALLLELEEEIACTRTGGQDLKATVRGLIDLR